MKRFLLSAGFAAALAIIVTQSPLFSSVVLAAGPVITNVSSTAAVAGATITWTTSDAANSQVEYGTSTAYTASTTLAVATSTAHSVRITSLTASTTYHFRVRSTDDASILATSSDYTFTTASFSAQALSLTSGNNATTTPNVATSITGFQIVGSSTSTTPVKIHVTNGTLTVSSTTGLTISGNNSATIFASGTVANLNAALSTLTYTRSSLGTDTLEVALVNSNQIYWPTNGHVYEYQSAGLSWENAKTASDAEAISGVHGYLATVTSNAENSFIYTRLAGDGWLSATDGDGSGDGLSHYYTNEDYWVWGDGPEASSTSSSTPFFLQNLGGSGGTTQSGWYSDWAGGEPNNYNGNEDCGYMYASNSGQWNDYPCDTQQGYVVEFGNDYDAMPNIVAVNVNITTADVPAISTLSPANAATNVNTSINPVITFSKSVTAGTGNILIKKLSDDTLVDTIAASSSQVTGVGTAAITIHPSASLADATGYYIIIPGTAFKDNSSNYFSGIAASSTWNFTTGDFTPPTISSTTATSTASTTASIAWTTNQVASTKVSYGLTASYSTSTSETDTSPRVTSHSVSLSSLLGCTTYHYAMSSKDASSNNSTSTDQTFTTLGCTASSTPTAVTSTVITSASGGSSNIQTDSKTFTVTAPASSTATSTSFVIQIKALPIDPIVGALGKPSASPDSVGATIFDVKAIINGTTILDSFNTPVTISYQYTDSEVTGINESTLKLYHYHNGAWVALDSCSVDTGANTITCTTPSFSEFGLFGSPAAPTVIVYVGAGGPLAHYTPDPVPSPDPALAIASPAVSRTPAPTASCPSYPFTRMLRFGAIGKDVLALQKFLNCEGFPLAASGPGSPGHETVYFVDRTYLALIKFQEAYMADILTPLKLTKGTGIFAGLSRKKAAALVGGQ